MTREYERTVDGRELTILVDVVDYPRFIIEGATDSETGEDVKLTADQEFQLYSELAVDMAGDLCDAAMDYYEDR